MTVQPYQQPQQAVQAVNGQWHQQPAGRRMQGICCLFHAFAKQGKSCVADSGWPPRLTMDLEGGAFWTPSRKVYWEPARETCPAWPCDPRAVTPGNPEGYWDTCIVITRTYGDLKAMRYFLERGQHPFNSVTLDSVSEMQQRFTDELAADKKMERDHWYAMLRWVNQTLRGYRDLITHPVKPVWSVSLVCGTHWDDRAKKWRPLLQGQSKDYVPYYPDILAWIEAQPDGRRDMIIGPHPSIETGERVGGRLPGALTIAYPGWPGWTLADMVRQVLS